MADKRIKGITIEIGSDTVGLQKALSDVNKKSNSLTKELKDVERLLKFNPGNVEALAQKQKLLTDQIQNTSEKLKQLKDAEKQVQEQFKKGDISEEQYRAFRREIEFTEGSLKGFESKLEAVTKEQNQAGDSAKDTGRKVEDLGESFSDVGEALAGATGPAGEFIGSLAATPWTAIAAGVAAVGGAAITAALQFEDADAKIQASLGLTKERAKELGEVAEEVWKNGWGESVDDVARSIVTVSKNLKDLPKEELQKAAEYAQILSDVMEVDVAESTRSVKQLMATFGMTAEESFDFLTKGFQEGLDFSGEFLDSINEYSPQFKAVGMDATDMFTLFKQGADNGAFNLDKLGDLVKEFNIRVKDGSKTTADAFASMSDETQALWDKFKEGKATGEEVFNAVVKELQNTEDKVKANQTAVGIFGTQWEDLEAEVVAALDTSINKLGEFEGATKKAGEALSDTKTAMLKEKYREITASTEEAINSFLYFALVTGEKQPEIAETFNIFGENVSKGTQRAVGAFLELTEEATTQVSLLKSSVIPLSEETASEVAGIYEKMATQVRDAIATRQEETLTSMSNFFATTSALTADEEANALSKMTSNYEIRSQVVIDGQNRIIEILNTAKEEKRSITDAEATEINAIQARMQTQAIEMMTQSEAEQKSILERLKVEAGNITAQQAANVVQNSLKQKNETIKAAEEQYDATVQEIIRQRDETGSITAEQADKLIREAKRQKDKSVAEAQIMHRDVVKEAKAQAGEQVDEVDWATGKMLSGYDKFKREAKELWDEHGDEIMDAIVAIVKFIAGVKFKLPRFELPDMPHFDLNFETKTFMGKSVSYPTGFDVDWYDKGAVFTGPQIIGVGEKRPEFVGALDDLRDIVRDEMGKVLNVKATGLNNGTGEILVEVPVYLDSYQIALATNKEISKMQGDQSSSLMRYGGLKR
jgi:phage-related minor tail protein